MQPPEYHVPLVLSNHNHSFIYFFSCLLLSLPDSTRGVHTSYLRIVIVHLTTIVLTVLSSTSSGVTSYLNLLIGIHFYESVLNFLSLLSNVVDPDRVSILFHVGSPIKV